MFGCILPRFFSRRAIDYFRFDDTAGRWGFVQLFQIDSRPGYTTDSRYPFERIGWFLLRLANRIGAICYSRNELESVDVEYARRNIFLTFLAHITFFRHYGYRWFWGVRICRLYRVTAVGVGDTRQVCRRWIFRSAIVYRSYRRGVERQFRRNGDRSCVLFQFFVDLPLALFAYFPG